MQRDPSFLFVSLAGLANCDSFERACEIVGRTLRSLTGARQITLHMRRGAAGIINRPLYGSSAQLPSHLPPLPSEMRATGRRTCLALHQDSLDSVWLTFVDARPGVLQMFSEVAPGVGRQIVTIRASESSRHLLPALLSAPQIVAHIRRGRDHTLYELAKAIQQLTGANCGLVVDANDDRLLRLLACDSERRYLALDVALDQVRGSLRRGLLQRGAVQLAGKQAGSLARTLGLPSAIRGFHFVPVSAGSYFSGYIGIGVEQSPDVGEAIPLVLDMVARESAAIVDRMAIATLGYETGLVDDRNELGLELHDSVLQDVSFLKLEAQLLQRDLEQANHPGQHRAREIAHTLAAASSQLRQLAGTLANSPAICELDGTIRKILADFNTAWGVRAEFSIRGCSENVPPNIRVQIVRTIHEALTNVAKHAHAACASVSLDCRLHRVEVSVRDDGRGFTRDVGPEQLGIRGMAQRIERVGGKLRVSSSRSQGTVVCADIPF